MVKGSNSAENLIDGNRWEQLLVLSNLGSTNPPLTSFSSRAISSADFGALVKSCRFTHRAVLNPSLFLLAELLRLDTPTDSAVDVPIPDRMDAPEDDPET